MSDYKKKMDIEDALKTMDSMLKVRRIDTRSKSGDVIETVLHEFYKQREKLKKIKQILKDHDTDAWTDADFRCICDISEVVEHE